MDTCFLYLYAANCFSGRSYGASVMLGQEFCESLYHTDFKLSETTLPFTRVGLCAVQVTASAEHIKDGISKLLGKGDFQLLRAKKKTDEVQKAEALQSAAWETLAQSPLDAEQRAQLFGRFQIRLILYLLQKQGKSRESKQYKSLTEIKEQFENDLTSKAEANPSTSASQVSASGAAASKAKVVKSLSSASDAHQIALAANKHIELGKNYVYKKDMDKVFQLKAFTSTGATLTHTPFFKGEETMEVARSEWKDLKPWSKPVPHLISSSALTSLLPSSSGTLEEEMARARAQWELYEKCQEFFDIERYSLFFI